MYQVFILGPTHPYKSGFQMRGASLYKLQSGLICNLCGTLFFQQIATMVALKMAFGTYDRCSVAHSPGCLNQLHVTHSTISRLKLQLFCFWIFPPQFLIVSICKLAGIDFYFSCISLQLCCLLWSQPHLQLSICLKYIGE